MTAGSWIVTTKLCSAFPPSFVAVTLIVALPAATAVTVTTAPSTATVATPGSEDSAAYVTPSPAKYSEAVTVCVSRPASVSAAMLPSAEGGAGTTVAGNWCNALTSPAVTSRVTVAVPTASGVSVSSDPAIEAWTTPTGETDTSKPVTASPKCSESSMACAAPPRISVTGGSWTVTAKLCPALPPAFVAVTVTVALPRATAVTVTTAPSTSTVATAASEDCAAYASPAPLK